MKFCCAKNSFLRMTSAAFAAALAVSACGGATGTSAGGNPTARVTVTVTVTAPVPSSPAVTPSVPATASPSPSPPADASYFLADLNPVQTHGINVDSSPHTVNGAIYDHSVAWSPGFSGDPYWAEWDLSRQCTWLTVAGAGLADDAPSGATAIFSVQTDGAYRWQQTISLGQSASLKVSVKGALRLRLTVTDTQNSVGSNATWGDAEVSCSAQPPNSKS